MLPAATPDRSKVTPAGTEIPLSTIAVHFAIAELIAEYCETVQEAGALATAATVVTAAVNVTTDVADIPVLDVVLTAAEPDEEVVFFEDELVFDEASLEEELILSVEAVSEIASTSRPVDEKDDSDAEELRVATGSTDAKLMETGPDVVERGAVGNVSGPWEP